MHASATTPAPVRVYWDDTVKNTLIEYIYKAALLPSSFGRTPLELVKEAQEKTLTPDLRRDIATLSAIPWLMPAVRKEMERAYAEQSKLLDACEEMRARLEKPPEVSPALKLGYVREALEAMPIYELDAVVTRRQSQQVEARRNEIADAIKSIRELVYAKHNETNAQQAGLQKQIGALERRINEGR